MSKSLKPHRRGAKVIWKWLGRPIHGKIIEVHLQSITKVIKGKSIKRNGSTANPAYVVESEAGNLALKLHSELQISDQGAVRKNQPRLFGGD